MKKVHPDIEDGSACNLEKLHKEGFFNSVFCSLNEEELGRYIKRAYRLFYMRPNYLLGRLKSLSSFEKIKRELRAGLKVFSFSTEK